MLPSPRDAVNTSIRADRGHRAAASRCGALFAVNRDGGNNRMKLSVITAMAMLATGPLTGPVFAQPSSQTATKASDQDLKSLISTKIANDKSLSADAVKVNVEGGVVTLTGMVGKDADKARIEDMAHVPGVVRVENKLTSRQKATDKTKDAAGAVADGTKKAAGATKRAISKSGEEITDGWISSRIKTDFMGEESLRASDIKVDTNDNVVTLTGAVPNAAAQAKAVSIAKGVEGVKRVVDKLQVAK
jgi:hyperosmotically inducible periplasmic protein